MIYTYLVICQVGTYISIITSKVFYGHGRDAYEQLGDEKTEKKNHNFFHLWDKEHVLMARHLNDKFEVYNHISTWKECKDEPLEDTIPEDIQTICKNKPGQIICYGNFGTRGDSDDNELTDADKQDKLRKRFF